MVPCVGRFSMGKLCGQECPDIKRHELQAGTNGLEIDGSNRAKEPNIGNRGKRLFTSTDLDTSPVGFLDWQSQEAGSR